jgi:hypothetical protein
MTEYPWHLLPVQLEQWRFDLRRKLEDRLPVEERDEIRGQLSMIKQILELPVIAKQEAEIRTSIDEGPEDAAGYIE